jgi:2-polyprenyl-3-methyl-5-hydroxy-6-metoxy-1,4-benzoquinol methylase
MDKETQQKLLNIVKKNYEDIADDFNQTRQKQLWPELVKLAADVKDGDSVLDVGCGNGRLTAAFIKKNIKYVGVDQSQALINLAQENIKAANFQFSIFNFQFRTGDILELDKLTQEKFDWIFCIAVLHHLPGQDLRLQALEQLKNRLKPNGKIVITVWNLWGRWKYLKLILINALLRLIGKNKMDFGDIVFDWSKNKSQRYYHAFTAKALSADFSRATLKIRTIYRDSYNYYSVVEKP